MLIRAVEFVPSSTRSNTIGGVKAIRVRPTFSVPVRTTCAIEESNTKVQFIEKQSLVEIKGTERIYPCDLVLIALSGGSVETNYWRGEDCHVPLKPNGMIDADINDYRTGVEGLFACGDCRT